MHSHGLAFRVGHNMSHHETSWRPNSQPSPVNGSRVLYETCRPSLLIVEDGPSLLAEMRAVFGHIHDVDLLPTKSVHSVGEALGLVESQAPTILLTDLNLDETHPRVLHGLKLLRRVRELYPDMTIFVASTFIPPTGRTKSIPGWEFLPQLLKSECDGAFSKGDAIAITAAIHHAALAQMAWSASFVAH